MSCCKGGKKEPRCKTCHTFYVETVDCDGCKRLQKVQVCDGERGPRGCQGDEGPTGPPGATGPQGPGGAQGATGPAGGPQGPQGFQGATGAQGFQGFQGAQGAAGADGDDGAQGFQGFQGFQGAQGSQGAQGQTGAQGESNPPGVLAALYSDTAIGGSAANFFTAAPPGPAGATSTFGVTGIGYTPGSAIVVPADGVYLASMAVTVIPADVGLATTLAVRLNRGPDESYPYEAVFQANSPAYRSFIAPLGLLANDQVRFFVNVPAGTATFEGSAAPPFQTFAFLQRVADL